MSGYDDSVQRAKEIAQGFIIMSIISMLLILAWNILNFLILQWFGFRYYGLSIASSFIAFLLMVFAFGPAICLATKDALPLGLVISAVTSTIVLIGLRIEAGHERGDW